MKSICIVPIYNEFDELQNLINKIQKISQNNNDIDFLLVDNGSNDGSSKIIENSDIKFIKLDKNYGVGFALIQGLKYSLKNQYELTLHIAGNGKMNPAEIRNFIDKIEIEKYDFVNGSRFLIKENYKTNPRFRIFAIKLLSIFISILYQKKLTDVTCGFRAFKNSIFKNGYDFFNKEKFYTYRYEYYSYGKILNNKKLKICEIPVEMKYKKKNYSKIRPIVDWFPIILGYLEARFDNKNIL